MKSLFSRLSRSRNAAHRESQLSEVNPTRLTELEVLEPRVLFSGTLVDTPPEGEGEDGGNDTMDQAVVNAGDGGEATAGTQQGQAADSTGLSVEEVEIIAEAAIQRWADAGISETQLAALESATYRIADLGGAHLGSAEGSVITIDDDAGGSGSWFLDATPDADEEFVTLGGTSALLADSRGEAAARYDLLTAVLHEQGHLLGLEEDGTGGAYGVMGAHLGMGTRRLPVAGEADGSEPGTLVGAHFLSAAEGDQEFLRVLGGYAEALFQRVDDDGNIILAGRYLSTPEVTDFNGVVADTNDPTDGGNWDVYVAKLDATGNQVYFKTFGGNGNDNLDQLHVDADGTVTVAGHFFSDSSITDFDGNAFSAASNGNADVFVARLDSSGNQIYLKTFGGNGNELLDHLHVDASGQVTVAGSLSSVSGLTDFDGNASLDVSNGVNDVYVARLDAVGNQVYLRTFGGDNFEFVDHLDVDANGNVTLMGGFESTIGLTDFDGNATSDVSNGSTDVFVARLDATGNQIYLRTFGGNTFEFVDRFHVDASGNVSIAGRLFSTNGLTDFDGNASSDVSKGNTDIYVARLDATGNQIYLKSFGGTGTEEIQHFHVDAAGNAFVGGRFGSGSGVIDFEGTPTDPAANATWDVYTAKLDALGNQVYLKTFGGTGTEHIEQFQIDAAGNLFVGGSFESGSGVTDFSGAANAASRGMSDVYVAKLDSLGNQIYLKTFGGTGTEHIEQFQIDAAGNILLGGRFGSDSGVIDFAGTPTNPAINGTWDVYVAKLDALGNQVYLKTFGGTGTEEIQHFHVDAVGNAFVGGRFGSGSGMIDFDGTPTAPATNGTWDVYVAKLDALGSQVYLKTFGGNGTEHLDQFHLAPEGSVTLAGRYLSQNNVTDFDGAISTISSNGGNDIFVARLAGAATEPTSPGAEITEFIPGDPDPQSRTVIGSDFTAVPGLTATVEVDEDSVVRLSGSLNVFDYETQGTWNHVEVRFTIDGVAEPVTRSFLLGPKRDGSIDYEVSLLDFEDYVSLTAGSYAVGVEVRQILDPGHPGGGVGSNEQIYVDAGPGAALHVLEILPSGDGTTPGAAVTEVIVDVPQQAIQGGFTAVPGLTAAVDVEAGSVVRLSSSLNLSEGSISNTWTNIEVRFTVDGVAEPVARNFLLAPDFSPTYESAHLDFEDFVSLTPGSHTIGVEIRQLLDPASGGGPSGEHMVYDDTSGATLRVLEIRASHEGQPGAKVSETKVTTPQQQIQSDFTAIPNLTSTVTLDADGVARLSSTLNVYDFDTANTWNQVEFRFTIDGVAQPLARSFLLAPRNPSGPRYEVSLIDFEDFVSLSAGTYTIGVEARQRLDIASGGREGTSEPIIYDDGTGASLNVLQFLPSTIPPFVAETEVSLDGNDLVITDVNGGDTADAWSLSVAGSNLTLTDLNGNGIDLTGTLDGTGNDGTDAVDVSLSAFSGNVILRSLGGDDDITLSAFDLTGGRGLVIEDGDGTDSVTFETTASTLAGGSIEVHAETVNASETVTTNGGDIAFHADDVALAGAVNAGSGRVTIAPLTAGREISLGSEVAGELSLTDAELDLVTAGVLAIGDTGAGAIEITEAISPAGTDTLRLTTGGEITEDSFAGVTVQNLAFQAGDTVAFNTANAIVTLAGTTSSGNILLDHTNSFTIGAVDGIAGVTKLGSGTVHFRVLNGDLTIDSDISSGGSLTLWTQGLDRTLSITAGVTVTSGGGTIQLRGDRMAIDGAVDSSTNVGILPSSTGRAIGIGSGTDAAGGTLEISDAELDRLSASVSSGIVIGDDIYTGSITVTGPITSSERLTFFTENGFTAEAPITAPEVVLKADLSADGQAREFQVNGDLTLADGFGHEFELFGVDSGNYDHLVSTGTVTIGTGVTLNITAPAGNPDGDTYVVIENQGSDPITGTFDGLAEGAILADFLGSGLDFQITYTGGDGNDVVLSLLDEEGPDWSQLGGAINGEAPDDVSGYHNRSVALSVDGNIVAIGAPDNDGNGAWSGHVRVFSWDGTAWNQMGADIDGEAAGDESGFSVALSDDGQTMAIGARFSDDGGSQSGHVRVFHWDGSAWNQLGADLAGEAVDDQSGWSVALSADGATLAVGAPDNDGNGAFSGHAKIYRWNGSAWSQLGADIDGNAAGGREGFSVALSADGNTIALGARSSDAAGALSGQARVFSWDGSAWVQLGADLPGENADDRFGVSVDLSADGRTLAVGARLNDDNGANSGHARVFSWNGSQWVQLGNDIAGENAGDEAGYSVALSDDGRTLAVGAHKNADNGTDSGQVRIFSWNGSAWTQVGADIDGSTADDYFGFSIALSADGKTLAASAPQADGGGSNTGQVRVFRFGEVSPMVAPGEVVRSGAGVATVMGLNGADAITIGSDGTNLIVSTPEDSLSAGVGATGAGNGDVLIPLAGLTELVIVGAEGDDTVTLEDLTGFDGSISIAGGEGFDRVILKNDLTLGADENAEFTIEEFDGILGSLTTQGSGSISIDATGGSGENFVGIDLLGFDLVATGTGAISLSGEGGDTGSNNQGIQLTNGSTVSSVDGEISLTGTGGNGTSHNQGVMLHSDASIASSGTGGVTIAGTGGDGTSFNDGVFFIAGSSASVTDGDLTIAGTAGNGSGLGNRGVQITTATLGSTGNGDILISGTGNGTASHNTGALLNGTTVNSTGAGDIHIAGTGSADGTDYNQGIKIAQSSIGSASGGILIEGSGGGSGLQNSGIALYTSSAISTSGTGALELRGTGASGTNYNSGISLNSGVSLRTSDGALSISGTGNGSGLANRGIEASGRSVVESTGSGSLTLIGTGSNAGTSLFNSGIYASYATFRTNDGDLTMTGNGGKGSTYNIGIRLMGSTVESVNGLLDLEGSASTTTSGVRNYGLWIANSFVQGGGGATLTGTGGGGTGYNHGAFLYGVTGSLTKNDVTGSATDGNPTSLELTGAFFS